MGLDHFTLTLSPTSRIRDYEPITKTITRNSDDFIQDYNLIKSGSKLAKRIGNNYDLIVTIKGYTDMQITTFYSSDHRLVQAVKNQDGDELR